VNILLTVHQFFPNYFSGTEVLTFSVAKELLRRGHNVAVLTGFPAATLLDDADRFDEYDVEGIHVFRFHHAYVPMGDQDTVTEIEYDNHLAAQYFVSLLEKFKPDVIHFFHFSRLGAGMIDAAVKAGIPAYYTPTDFWSICPTSQLLLHGGDICGGPSRAAGNCVKHVAELTRGPRARQITRLIPDSVADVVVQLTTDGVLPRYPLSNEVAAMSRRRPFLVSRLNWLNRIIAPTQLVAGVLKRNGVNPDLILNSGYGIDAGGYDTDLPKVAPGEALVIGFIGTPAPHKGPHVLLEAFKGLPAGKARLKIYGNPADFPDYYAGLQKRADGMDTIEFCGTFPNHEIGKVLSGIHVLVVPSLWYENTPLVVHSSLAAKRPVIASNFAGLSEAVKHEQNGLTFTPGDFLALRQALQRLFDEPALLGRMADNCRPPKSSVEYVDELLALYSEGMTKPALPRDLGTLRDFPALARTDQRGALSGWAVIGFGTPARMTLKLDGKTLGETVRFMPRPDVRDGLRRNGAKIKTSGLGYSLKLPHDIDRQKAVLQCESSDGRVVEVPLRDLACGNSVHLGGGDYMAIDSERVMWQAQGTQF
jgi:glycosyltransferase involved in cell wall biosynthesis